MTSTIAHRPDAPVRSDPPSPPPVPASEVAEELAAMVVRAPDLGVDHDLVLVDRLETLALKLWVEVHDRLGLPRWVALSSPSNRWVVLERSVGRLHQRLDDPRLQELVVRGSTQGALQEAREAWARAGAPALRP